MKKTLLIPALVAAAHAADMPITVDPPNAISSSWSVEWNTAGNTEGWSPVNSSATVSGGLLSGTSSSNDPAIQRTGISGGPDLDYGWNDFIELRIKVPSGYTGPIQISYGTTPTYAAASNSGFVPERVMSIPAEVVPDDGAFHVYRLDVGQVPRWRGFLSDLKIEPVDGAAAAAGMAFAIDYIRIGDEPNAQVYARHVTVNCPDNGGATPAVADFGPGQAIVAQESKHFRMLWNSASQAHAFWTANTVRNSLRNLEECWQLLQGTGIPAGFPGVRYRLRPPL